MPKVDELITGTPRGSTKKAGEEIDWQNEAITLEPLNSEFEPIILANGDVGAARPSALLGSGMPSCDDLRGTLTAAQVKERLIDPALVDPAFWNFAHRFLTRAYRGAQERSPLERFIYLWVAFDAWASAALVLEPPDERQAERFMVASAGHDPIWTERFAALTSTPENRRIAAEFAALWPVLKVRALRRLELPRWDGFDRQGYVRRILHGPNRAPTMYQYAPSCYLQHESEQHQLADLRWMGPPVDWKHTMSAIYMVRCNLFHGGKNEDHIDSRFVEPALHVLAEMWRPDIPQWAI